MWLVPWVLVLAQFELITAPPPFTAVVSVRPRMWPLQEDYVSVLGWIDFLDAPGAPRTLFPFICLDEDEDDDGGDEGDADDDVSDQAVGSERQPVSPRSDSALSPTYQATSRR